MADFLEQNNVITNSQALYDDPSFTAASGVRMGTPEMTRYGMKEPDFAELAGLVATIVCDGERQPEGWLRDQVVDLRGRFRTMQYCL